MRLALATVLGVLTAQPAVAEPPADLSPAALPASPAVALLEGWRRPDGRRVAAIEIRLGPGWHTYWRVPGAAGIPPEFDWSRSENLASVAYEWPRPTVSQSFGMRTFIYPESLVLPALLTPEDPRAPMRLAVELFFGVCSDICIPAEARLGAEIAPDTPARGRARIEAALAERAQRPDEAGVVRATCALAPGASGHELTVEVAFAADTGPDQVTVIEAGQPDLWIGEAETRSEGRTVAARAPVAAASGTGPVLERQNLRVTVLDAHRAVDIRGCEAPG